MPGEEANGRAPTETSTGDASGLGMELRTVTPQVARELGLDEATGVVVLTVDPMGPAARGGLRRGDVILEADRRPIADANGLAAAIQGVDSDAVLLKVVRGGSVTYVALEIG